LSFVVIIWMKGILVGWDHQARSDMKNWEIGGGQYWHETYDPYDPFTLTLAHAPIPASLASGIDQGEIEPVLITQGTIYPSGRMQSILIKGIDPGSSPVLLHCKLDTAPHILAIIGTRMASNKLKVGIISLLLADAHGTGCRRDLYRRHL
jgi:hypothetical protein